MLSAFTDGQTTQVDFVDPERAVDEVMNYVARYTLSAIVDEGTTTIAALASNRPGLPHNHPAAVAATADKYGL